MHNLRMQAAMSKNKVLKEHLTQTYYSSEKEEFFYMAYKQLFTASHWVDPVSGEEVKLTHNLKAVYTHKMDQYKSFKRKGQVYRESAQRVADIIGVSVRTVEDNVIPLLKRMGLIRIDIRSPRDCTTTMFPLKQLRGSLINKKLQKHNKKKEGKKKTAIQTERTEQDYKNRQANIKEKQRLIEELQETQRRLLEIDNDIFAPPKTKGVKFSKKEKPED